MDADNFRSEAMQDGIGCLHLLREFEEDLRVSLLQLNRQVDLAYGTNKLVDSNDFLRESTLVSNKPEGCLSAEVFNNSIRESERFPIDCDG